VYVELWKLKMFFSVLDDAAVDRLGNVAPAHYGTLKDFVASGANGRASRPQWISNQIDVLWRLHAYREHITDADDLPMPWPGFTAAEVAGYRDPANENDTPRIPEDVMAPLLRWALFYVDVAAPDVLACAKEWRTLRGGTVRRPGAGSSADKLTQWLEQRRTAGRGLPMAGPRSRAIQSQSPDEPARQVNLSLVAAYADLAAGQFSRRPALRALINEAALTMPLEIGGLTQRPSLDPATGEPWHPGIGPNEIEPLEAIVITACYIIVAYLSGMRDSEVRTLRRGALRTETLEDGRLRYWVDGRAYKGENSEGAPASWVVIEPVAKAIEVLESIHHHEYLFARPWPERGTPAGAVPQNINRDLNQFIVHVNRAHSNGANAQVVPDIDGRPWNLTSRQFRRTIAWHIANRPFGLIALKIQYHHVNVATSIGYAGDSASGFRAEVENERLLGSLDDIFTMFERRRLFGEVSTGPGGALIDAEFDRIAAATADVPIAAREDRVRSMLRDRSTILWVGPICDCFFRADKAACLKHLPLDERVAPVVALCDPTQCTNARIGPKHRERWGQLGEEAAALAKRSEGLPLIQVDALMLASRRAMGLAQAGIEETT
jgi:integrase